MLVTPTVHLLAPESGTLSGCSQRYDKRLSELEGIYADANAFSTALSRGDGVVYAVEDYRPSKASGDLCFGVTHMQPGESGTNSS